MKSNDAYRTVSEKRGEKHSAEILSPPPPFTQKKKKCTGNFNVFISCPKPKQNKQ